MTPDSVAIRVLDTAIGFGLDITENVDATHARLEMASRRRVPSFGQMNLLPSPCCMVSRTPVAGPLDPAGRPYRVGGGPGHRLGWLSVPTRGAGASSRAAWHVLLQAASDKPLLVVLDDCPLDGLRDIRGDRAPARRLGQSRLLLLLAVAVRATGV